MVTAERRHSCLLLEAPPLRKTPLMPSVRLEFFTEAQMPKEIKKKKKKMKPPGPVASSVLHLKVLAEEPTPSVKPIPFFQGTLYTLENEA